jgi:hypothetical protein
MATEEQKGRVKALKKHKQISLLPGSDSAKLAAIAQSRKLAKATMIEMDRKKDK